MGIHAIAYQNVELVEARTPATIGDDEWDTIDDAGLITLFGHDFPARMAPLVDGIYRPSGETADVSHSYSGYGYLRELITEAVHGVTPQVIWDSPEDYEDRPLFEWINFSDCEGTLGPTACANINEALTSGVVPDDFLDGQHHYMQSAFTTWRHMFALAAGTGAISYG